MAVSEQLPDRPVVEEMAAKAAKAGKFGKPISEMDDVERMAVIWEMMSSERDRRASALTPLLLDLERMVREIETEGFSVTVTMSRAENDLAQFSATIDIPDVTVE